jgi:hypothetical protein
MLNNYSTKILTYANQNPQIFGKNAAVPVMMQQELFKPSIYISVKEHYALLKEKENKQFFNTAAQYL